MQVAGPREGADDAYGRLHASGLHVTGRIVLNVWRLLRTDLKLNNYTLHNCAAAVLKQRLPCIGQTQLHAWWLQGPSGG